MYKITQTKSLQVIWIFATNFVFFFGRPRFSSVETEQATGHNSTDPAREGQAVSGGYNDAFIIQF
jgi:hypothetical protein